MTYKGKVSGKVISLPEGVEIPEGTEVTVVVKGRREKGVSALLNLPKPEDVPERLWEEMERTVEELDRLDKEMKGW